MSKPENILVVDDEEPIREIISAMLCVAGYQVQQAVSAMEALAVLNAKGESDLLLADLMMPQIDGLALLETVKEKFPEMPVIIVTGVHDISVALAAIRNGAHDYLLKPFEREQLLQIIRRTLEHRRLKLENRVYQANLESVVTARTEQLRRALTDLERSYDVTLEALADAMDLRDAETVSHSKRVTAFTIAVVRAMGLSGERIRAIARGAFLHDVGKLGIPEAILHNPGPLTQQETAIMREHCSHGYRMLHKIPFLEEPSEIVYAHLERYDGTGYPRGIRGDEIPLGARIVAVACALDKITSHRPCRAAQPLAAAREEIFRLSGSQFDPAVVSIFLKMPESTWENLADEIASQNKRLKHHSMTQREKEKPASIQ